MCRGRGHGRGRHRRLHRSGRIRSRRSGGCARLSSGWSRWRVVGRRGLTAILGIRPAHGSRLRCFLHFGGRGSGRSSRRRGRLCRWTCFRECNWIGRRGCLLGQLGHGQFHRVIDRDPGDSFGLVDPGVGREGRSGLFSRRLQLLGPDFGPLLLISVSARRGANNDQNQEPKEGEEQHDTDPRREDRARLVFVQLFVRYHG